MPDGGASVPDWFSQLEPAESSRSIAPPPGLSQPAQAPGTPTIVVRPTGQTASSGFATPPDWFSKLEQAESQSAPSPSAPAWAPGGRNVQLDQGTKQTPDLPSWAGGGAQSAPQQAPAPQPMSQPIGAGQFGEPIFGNDAENDQVRGGQGRILEKMGEGATMGTLPFAIAGARSLAGTPYRQGLDEARQYTAKTSQDYPGASMLAEGAGSLLPTALTFGAANPAIMAAGRAIPYGGALAQGAVGAGLGAASAAGQDIGAGTTANIGQDVKSGAMTGGLLGAVPPALGQLARSAVGAASPEVAQLAQLGRDTYGIPITAGQMSGNRMIKTADSVLKSIPFSGHGALDDEVQLAVNRATARTMGEDAPKLTPNVMNAARTRIGGVLQDVETRNAVNFDQPLMDELGSIESNARSSLTDPEYGVIQRQLHGVMSNLRSSNDIAGETYGNLIHKGSPLDAAANSNNSNISGYASQIKEALRGSLQRSLSGDDLAAYQQARTQWKNMRTIEPLTQAADVVGGPSASTGDINPTLLRGAVNRAYPRAAFSAPGEVPLNDIADIGQRFLKETPTSHTSERGWMLHMLSGLGGAMAEGGGLPSASTMIGGGAGLLGSALAARGASRALQSRALADQMIRNSIGGQAPSTGGMIGQAAKGAIPEAGKPKTSVNPSTGMPEFSLRANQHAAPESDSQRAVAQVVGAVRDGSLADHERTAAWISSKKMDLRRGLGGQGIQAVAAAAALPRRPGTLYHLATNAYDHADLVGAAIQNPELLKTLRMTTRRTDLPRAARAQIEAAMR